MRIPGAILLATTQSARLVGPGLAMLLLAGVWSAAEFGAFAGTLALASLLGLVPATGLSAWLLDQSARRPGAARAMLGGAWRGLALLALPLLLAGALTTLTAANNETLLLTLTAAMLLAGAADNGFASLRAQHREADIARIALPANLAVLAAAAVLHSSGAEAVALTWLAVRALQVAAVWLAARRSLPAPT